MVQRIFVEKILLALAILSAVNVIIGIFFGLFFPVGYFSGKSIPRIVSDLAFVEGATVFFGGALSAFYGSPVSERAKALLVIGALMLGISVAFGAFV
jgi:predicted membrane protein